MSSTYYDVALSYATPDVDVANTIYAALSARRFRVFYDRGMDTEQKAEMWGKNLDDYLNMIFKDKARYCIILASVSYVNRAWTDVERKAARSRQIMEKRDYILPITLDGTRLPNMEYDVHIDYTKDNADGVAEIFAAKHDKLLRPDDRTSISKLTPVEPEQHEFLTAEWESISRSAFDSTLNDGECAWVLPIQPGRPYDEFDLIYHPDHYGNTYDDIALPMIEDIKRDWGRENHERFADLSRESWGKQVRLMRLHYDDERFRFTLHLGPIKYLHYICTHARLWAPELRPLRERVFKNAIHGLSSQDQLVMPSHFCIHMAILSKNREALLRQRRFHAELYPGAWEVGMGEFMHGPDKEMFPSFDKNKIPSMSLFLKSCIAEEINYSGARAEDFALYGFAVEYRTLAPKLLVIYQSDISIDKIIDGARKAKDFCQDATFVKVSPEEIARVMKNKAKFSSWGPTSKLVLWLSLLKEAQNETERRLIKEKLERELIAENS